MNTLNLENATSAKPEAGRKNLLTPKEARVLLLASHGKSTTQIASEMGVSTSTIETHRKSVLKKLNAKNMIHAVAQGIRSGIIE